MQCRKCRAEIQEGSVFCSHCGAKQTVTQRTKSRGNGQGSVYQRSNKTWIAFRVIGYTIGEDGKKHKQTVSKSGFKTKREAVAYLPLLQRQQPSDKRKMLTFWELYEKWEPTHQASASTINCYRSAKKWFQPVWNMRFAEIDIDDLQDCLDECDRGKRTKENMKALCGLLYKYAIPRHQATLNLGQYLVIRGDSGPGKEGLPLEALQAIVDKKSDVAWAEYVVAQCYLGFRPSELLALDVKDYDRKEKAFTGGAKTDAGKDRTVTVSPKVQPIVDRLVSSKIGGPVFCREDGSAMPLKEYRQIFYGVLDKCGVENPTTEENGVNRRKYTPHSCRHTFATLIKSVDAPDKDKLELMGHTSTEMLRHYQDVSFDDLRRITDAI